MLNHQGVFSLLERTLPVALFPRVWGTVRFTAVTKPNRFIVAGYTVTVSSRDSHLYGKRVIWDTPRCIAEQKGTSKVSHATIACIITDLILVRFQACLKVDSYF